MEVDIPGQYEMVIVLVIAINSLVVQMGFKPTTLGFLVGYSTNLTYLHLEILRAPIPSEQLNF